MTRPLSRVQVIIGLLLSGVVAMTGPATSKEAGKSQEHAASRCDGTKDGQCGQPGKPDSREVQRTKVPRSVPCVDEIDFDELRCVIKKLMKVHGKSYRQGSQHLERCDALQQTLWQAEGASADGRAKDQRAELKESLVQLQRDVLLFDVDKLLVIKRHEITASHVYTYHYEGFKAGGGLYVVSPHDPDAQPVELVASPDGQILDCDVSHDGKVILFSWRQRGDEGYHLWTTNVDGTNLTQLTDGPWHDYNACWLPDGEVAFLHTRGASIRVLLACTRWCFASDEARWFQGRKLSANYLNDFTPQILDDGRIIYSRWEYVDRPAIPIQSLWTINPDGTGLSGFFGNRILSPGTFMEARSIPGTRKIICTMTGHNGPTRAIGVIDRSKGVNAQASIENVTPEVSVPRVDQGNGNTHGAKPYSCPVPLDGTRFLVSARGPVLVRTISGECQSTAVRARVMECNISTLYRSGHVFAPVIPSMLSDQSRPDATVFVQDIYNGLEPSVKRGEVKTIRVVREMQKTVRIDPHLRAFGFQFPVISCGATYAGKDVLGDVAVESDGSACFRVPAGVPVSFMVLDGQGRAVQRMRSFTHFMPGEVHGCVGCHEHRSQGPLTRPGAAANHPPKDLEPPEWGAGGFDYSRIVQPVLDKHCIQCHNAIDPPKKIDLTGSKTDFFNVSYDVLARENQGGRGSPYVNWIPTYNGQEWNVLEIEPNTWGSPRSKLADVIVSGHPDKSGKRRVEMDEKSRRRILAWIDLNVPYYGTSETAYPDNPGCRRLYPSQLDNVLNDVAKRRCATCHHGSKIPRREWLRITEPELNNFLVAPLAKSAGGSEKCGKAVFNDKNDPDYQAILATFQPIEELLKKKPRMDMPGARPAEDVNRSSQ